MRYIIIFSLCLFFCTLLPDSSYAQSQNMRDVTKQEALAIAKSQFVEKDFDYYLVKSSNPNDWQIFVDTDPLKGWEHPCFMLYIPKNISSKGSTIHPIKISLKLPPDADLESLSVIDRGGNSCGEKPYVNKASLTNDEKMVAQHTYAVILSGGVNKNCNHERYWNDCSFVYQVLTRKYGVPKSNIKVIMSDGTDPADDMRTMSGQYQSSPLDLDGDGIVDIGYSATRSNIQSVINELGNQLQEDDHLLFFVIDHGGSLDGNSKSYICLWDNESLIKK